MSRFQRLFKKNYSYKNSSKNNERCYYRRNLLIFIFIFVFLLAYLFNVTGLSHLGYDLKRLEDKMSALESQNLKLELEVAKLQSLTYLKEKVSQLGLVEVDSLSYLNNNQESPDLTVAMIK